MNIELGIEEASTVPKQYSFYPTQQQIEKSIKKYNNVPAKNFINEGYFLYNKSNLVKESYITAINKKISLNGSTSYLNSKTENEMLKMISLENLYKFLVNRDSIRNNLSF